MVSFDSRRLSAWECGGVVVAMMAAAALIELGMGRLLLCQCGTIRFWVGGAVSPEISQQIADWYSFSHIIHGFALYGFFYWLGGRRRGGSGWPLRWRLVLAAVLEVGWELLENSPLIIARYRQTAAQGYTGDTVVNSMSDILFCLIGFGLAAKLPVWLTVALTVVMELGVAYVIRDNLTLNIIMLIHPFAGIRKWQMGAAY